jgi:hypothetical protein
VRNFVAPWLVAAAVAVGACSQAPGEPAATLTSTRAAPAAATSTAVASTIATPSPDLEQRMREDLAQRLAVAPSSLRLVSFRPVTWATGCIGVNRPGQVCSQMLAPGFLAIWTDANGATYRYHGSGEAFIAASFEPGATLSNPFPATPVSPSRQGWPSQRNWAVP